MTSGVLSLVLSDSGSGFTSSITNMAPGDTVIRYVNLTQGADIDARSLTLGVVSSADTKLTNDGTKGLHVTVAECSVAWVSGACAPTSAAWLASTGVNALIAAPTALGTGVMVKGTTVYLQLSVVLSDQAETTVNGVAPTASPGTIQGLSTNLTWTFTDVQRAAATTSS